MTEILMPRVLVTGMGGELGTRVAQLLEQRDDVGEIHGLDFAPPRRRLRRAEFHRIDPRRRERLRDFVLEFAPTHVAHFGVYEPASRMSPTAAAERTELCSATALAAAGRAGALQGVVLRSGLEVYGSGRRAAAVPDESVPPAPGRGYGKSLLGVETIGAGIGRRHDVPVASLRYAPIVGSHVPSPLGRLLRLPFVPVSATSDPPFSLLHPEDACRSMVQALVLGVDGPVNVAGPGAVTPWQAVRLGGRVPVPVLPFAWGPTASATEMLGAAIAPHVVELLCHGRTGCGQRAIDELELGAVRSTREVVEELFEWAEIVPIERAREIAA
jgi:UDP-glucose 4-epimerase